MEQFLKLYERVYEDLYRFACFYLGSPADAEDAVQDAALAAWEHFGKLRKEEAFRSWMFQILVNVCRKSLKKKAGRETLPEMPERESSSVSNLTERLEILELLSVLDEEERLIVLLFVFGGYKGEEVAAMLKRRHSTIRSRYRRALKKLERELLKKEERG